MTDDNPMEATDADEPRSHDGIPIRGYYFGEPVADLNALPRARWPDMLRPLRERTQRRAVGGLQSQEAVIAGQILVSDLMLEDAEARIRARDAPPPRMPRGAPPIKGSLRQVNFRLGPDEHARLLEAARLFGMPPTTLARVLTVRGVDVALYEERRNG
ncbi:MAG: hypothetical protein Q8K79_14940 [Solirubrobacteraceae bacterium]|nr:hypothetical protein [Solirubrobacteraceae bacterium]